MSAASPKEEVMVFRYGLGESHFRRFLFFFSGSSQRSIETFELGFSVSGKVTKMEIAFQDIFLQLPNWQEEQRTVQEQGISGSIESVRLALRYETYLNSIYSLCEILAKIVLIFYPKENLPHGFFDQKKRFKNRLTDEPYAKTLTTIEWYDEVHAFRGEATHFLSGFITNDKDDNPGYFNRVLSKRDGIPQEASKENLVEHVTELNKKVFEFLEAFGELFLQFLDPNSSRTVLCLRRVKTGQIFTKNLTLSDVLREGEGTCSSPNVECPLREGCAANKNLLISLGPR